MAAQKKLTEAELVKKKANTKQPTGGIRNNVAVTKIKKEYFQKFVNLAVNESPLPQGDGIIRISPFDDYFLFTMFDTIEGEDTPIDLTNVGTIYITFIGTTDEIDIKNHTQVKEVDLSKGEVLFRISRSDSKKILALDNENFYISTRMISPDDGSISDESVLYQGIWLAFDAANRITLLSQIEEQRESYSTELAILKEENTELKRTLKKSTINDISNDATILSLQQNNTEMANEIAELTADLKSTKIQEMQRRTAAVNKAVEEQKLANQQKRAMVEAVTVAGTGAIDPGFWKNAAKNLQNYTIGNNTSTTIVKGPNNEIL
jgi:hypothetical protein